VHDGAIGDVRAFYSTYNGGPNGTVARTAAMSDMEMQIRNWYHFPWLSGDHIVEQAVHSLDKMAWTFKDEPPKNVVAIGGRSVPGPAERGNGYGRSALSEASAVSTRRTDTGSAVPSCCANRLTRSSSSSQRYSARRASATPLRSARWRQ